LDVREVVVVADGRNSQKNHLQLVIVTGNPGVFQGYLYPYPCKPIPTTKGRGFGGSG